MIPNIAAWAGLGGAGDSAEGEGDAAAPACEHLTISVVSTRSDLLPWYEKMGFQRVKEAPFPDPERTTREVSMIIMQAPIEALC